MTRPSGCIATKLDLRPPLTRGAGQARHSTNGSGRTSGAATMAPIHGSEHPVLSARRRPGGGGDRAVLAPRALAPCRAAQRAAARPIGPRAGSDQGARRLRLRPAASAPGSRPRPDARVRVLGLHRAAGHDRQLRHQRAGRDDRRLVLRRLLLERDRLLREPLRRARAGIGHLLRHSSDDHAAGPPGADARRLRDPRAHLLHRADRVGRRRLLVRRRARRARHGRGRSWPGR